MDHETLFIKCKESLVDVVGWKVFIFLPNNFGWKFFIFCTVLVTAVMRSVEFFYGVTYVFYEYIEVIIYCFYLVDTVCATLHYFMPNTRKLRHGKPRPFLFLILDYLSLIPISFMQDFFLNFAPSKTVKVMDKLKMNVCLRIYKVHTFFCEVKFWSYRMSVFFFISCLEVVTWMILITHAFNGILFVNYDKGRQEQCLENFISCLIESELLCFSLVSQSYTETFYHDPLENMRVFTVIVFITGYFLTFGFYFPIVHNALLNILQVIFDFSNQCQQLESLIDNLTSNKALKAKIFKYFKLHWKYGKGSKQPCLTKIFPEATLKSMYSDIHWEAFRHSEFLRNVSLGCKRALSLKMQTEYVLPNTILFDLNDKKSLFMYLESGMVQLMAEENSESPVLSLSDGTVLGEITIFFPLKSKAILKTAKLSVIHFLKSSDLMRTMVLYPQDMKKMFALMNYRIEIVRCTYIMKTEICPEFLQSNDEITSLKIKNKAAMKWVKKQIRNIEGYDEAYEKLLKNEDKALVLRPQLPEISAEPDHTSLYLSLLAANDEIITKFDVVCLKNKFPWIIDPNSDFLKVWKTTILIIVFASTLIYPAIIGWYPYFPRGFFTFSTIVSTMYIIDVILISFTAVPNKNRVMTKFRDIMTWKLTSLIFYVDILAAMPFQILLLRYRNTKPYYSGLYIINSMLKIYRLVLYLIKWNYRSLYFALLRTFIKNIFLLLCTSFVLCVTYKVTKVDCLFFYCNNTEWLDFRNDSGSIIEKQYFSVVVVMILGHSMPFPISGKIIVLSLIIYLLSFFIYRLLFLLWHIECLSCYICEKFHHLKYKKLTDVVVTFIEKHNIIGRLKNRVADTINFQWYYDKGNYFTHENRLIDDIQPSTREELDKDSLLHTLKSCSIFQLEDNNFLLDLCRKSSRLSLPANSVLLTFGTQIMCMYVIHRGWVQVNSFLTEDLVNNVGTAIYLTKGQVFPVMIVLKQIPSFLTVRTVTDCELIVLNLEDILSTMIVHDVFQDLVQTLKETMVTIPSARPGLSRIDDSHLHHSRFRDKKSYFLINKAFDCHSKTYIRWETFRISCIVVSLLMWPFAFGLFAKKPYKMYVIYFLLLVDSITIIDIYIRMFVAYYDSQGLYIDSPSKTAKRYLETSFIIDFSYFVILVHMTYLVLTGVDDYNLTIICIHLVVRFLSWYRISGFIDYTTEKKTFSFKIWLFQILVIIFVFLNMYVNVMLYLYFVKNLNSVFPDSNTKDTFELYITELLLNLKILGKTEVNFKGFTFFYIINALVFGILSWAIQIVVYTFLSLNFMSSSKTYHTYRNYLKNFLNFLNSEGTNDKLLLEVKEHYEYVWRKKESVEFKDVFSRFPTILHEDLTYSLYKSTLSAVRCLSKANVAFYRILSRNVEEVYLKKGSTVIFENQVQKDIFFIFKGQCLIEKTSVTLLEGSMLGDMRRKGIMTNTIKAKTHIVLLKVRSDVFYVTMSNFFYTKNAYEEEVKNVDDYVQSYRSLEEENKEIESFFELNSAVTEVQDIIKDKPELIYKTKSLKKPLKLINPTSKTYSILKTLFLLDAVITSLWVPIIIGTRSFSLAAIITIYLLDIIWIVKIVCDLNSGYLDPKTGNFILDKKAILHKYVKRFNGFVLDVISIIPLEVIGFIYNAFVENKLNCCMLLYSLRILRISFVNNFMNREKERLTINTGLRVVLIFGFKIFAINLFTCLNMIISESENVKLTNCYSHFDHKQIDAYLSSLLCMVSPKIFLLIIF